MPDGTFPIGEEARSIHSPSRRAGAREGIIVQSPPTG
jgi:hypothetical protein